MHPQKFSIEITVIRLTSLFCISWRQFLGFEVRVERGPLSVNVPRVQGTGRLPERMLCRSRWRILIVFSFSVVYLYVGCWLPLRSRPIYRHAGHIKHTCREADTGPWICNKLLARPLVAPLLHEYRLIHTIAERIRSGFIRRHRFLFQERR